jgi:hypothetical protein
MQSDQRFINLIKPGRLGEVVCLMLDDETAQLKEWHCEPIHGGLEFGNAVIHCQGTAVSGDQVTPWSLIVKIASKGADSQDPQGYRYWKREALAYQSGYLSRIPAYLSAPIIYAIDEEQGNTVLIWMEDLADDYEQDWSLEVYEQAAFQLGLFNGSYLTQQEQPEDAWMARDWLKKYVGHAEPVMDFIFNNLNHPLIESLYGKGLPSIMALWAVRHDLFHSLDALPYTFCHQDAFKRNLFFNKGQLTAIDWGYAGMAPLGTELVPLIAVLQGIEDIPQEQVLEMNRLCFDAYLRGDQSVLPKCFTPGTSAQYIVHTSFKIHFWRQHW